MVSLIPCATLPDMDKVEFTPVPQMPDVARMRFLQASAHLRDETRQLSDCEVVREIRDVVARGLAMIG